MFSIENMSVISVLVLVLMRRRNRSDAKVSVPSHAEIINPGIVDIPDVSLPINLTK